MKIKSKINLTLMMIYIIINISPLLSRKINIPVLFLLVFSIFITSLKRKVIVNNVIILFCLFVGYLTIEYIRVFNITLSGNYFQNILFLFPFLIYLIKNSYQEFENPLTIKIFLMIFLFIQTYVAFENICLLITDSTLSKYMTANIDRIVLEYSNTNLGTVETVFISQITVLINMYIFNYHRKKIYKSLCFISIIINIGYVVLSGSFINLVVLCLGIIFYILFQTKINKTIKLMAILIAILLIISIIILSQELMRLVFSSKINVYYKMRIIEILQIFLGNTGPELVAVGGRVEDYLISLKTFLLNPIFGAGMIYTSKIGMIGMHSELFDSFGRYGVVGIVFIYNLMNKFYKENLKRILYPIFLTIFAYIIVNPIVSSSSGILLFWILPLLQKYYTIIKLQKHNYIKKAML